MEKVVVLLDMVEVQEPWTWEALNLNYLPSRMQFVPHPRLKEEECQKALDMVEETLVMEAVVYEALKAVKVLEVVELEVHQFVPVHELEATKAVEVLEALQAVQALEMHQFVPVHELDVPHLANTIYPTVLDSNQVDVVHQSKEVVSPVWIVTASP